LTDPATASFAVNQGAVNGKPEACCCRRNPGGVRIDRYRASNARDDNPSSIVIVARQPIGIRFNAEDEGVDLPIVADLASLH